MQGLPSAANVIVLLSISRLRQVRDRAHRQLRPHLQPEMQIRKQSEQEESGRKKMTKR